MSHVIMKSKVDTLTFRIQPELKMALTEVAQAESKPVGKLLRELVRACIEQKRRRQFEAEARRQSLEAAAAARDPHSDEGQVMRELEADLDAFAEEWK